MGKQKLTEEHVEIVDLRRKQGIKIKEVAKELGVTHTTLIRFMRKHGIQHRKASKATQLSQGELPELYKQGATLTELSRQFGVDYATVRGALDLAGVPVRENWSRNKKGSVGLANLTDEESDRLIEQYTGGATLGELAAQHKVSAYSVRKHLQKRGVDLRSAGPAPKSERERRDTKLRREYGISVDEYEALEAGQGGRCAICGVDANHGRNHGRGSLCIDHDHNTGKVRGLLCHTCNLGLAYYNDDPQLFDNCGAYLRRNS